MEARLVNVLRETFGELDDLWRSIGLTAKERAEQVDSLFKETCDLCRSRIATEKALAASYEEEVKRLREDIAICAERLDLPKQMPSQSEKLPLVKELTTLRGDYEELDKKRSEMENVMTEKLSMLHRSWDMMRTRYEPGFESVGFKLTSKRMSEIDHKVNEVRKECERRLVLVRSRIAEAYQLMEMLELDEHPATAFDHSIATRNEDAIGLSAESIEMLDKRIMELQTERQSREAIMMRLLSEIQSLWHRLDVPTHERESFMRRYGTLGDKSTQAMEAKLSELREMRRQRMSDFIERVRAEMRSAMEEAHLPPMERSKLTRLLSETVVSDNYEACSGLLTRHETELEKLRKIVESVRPIVRASQKYLQMCQERIEYEALIADSSRLLNRKRGGPSLQEEEKMRRRVADIPKNVMQLKQMVEEFETAFLGGERLILSDVLGEDKPVMLVVENTEREHDDRVQREKEQRTAKKHEASAPVVAMKKVGPAVAPSTVKRAPLRTKN